MLLGDVDTLVVLVVTVANLVALLLVAGVALLIVDGLVDRLVRSLALGTRGKYLLQFGQSFREMAVAMEKKRQIRPYFDCSSAFKKPSRESGEEVLTDLRHFRTSFLFQQEPSWTTNEKSLIQSMKIL